jgi:hypothetical protein
MNYAAQFELDVTEPCDLGLSTSYHQIAELLEKLEKLEIEAMPSTL